MTTPQLALRELEAAQSQPEIIVNEDIRALEAAISIRVLDKDLATPPTSPAANARYIVPAVGATGAWSTFGGKIVYLRNTTWAALTPQRGWIVFVEDENTRYEFDGAEWVAYLPGGISIVGDDGSPNLTINNVTTIHVVNATVEDLGGGQARITCVGTGGGGGASQGHGTLTGLTISSNTITLDHSLGADFTLPLSANVTTVNHSNITNSAANWFSLRIVQGGGFTFAPPASWIYPSGVSAYTASAGAADVDLIQGVTYDNGTTWMISYEKDYA